MLIRLRLAEWNAFWGDSSWEEAGYTKTRRGLFGDVEQKTDNETLAKAYQKRLMEVAGFDFVPRSDSDAQQQQCRDILLVLCLAQSKRARKSSGRYSTLTEIEGVESWHMDRQLTGRSRLGIR